MNKDNLDSIFERIASHQYTQTDILALRQAISSFGDTQVTQQLGKYNVNIADGKYIHIGDKIYLPEDGEALESLIRLIQSKYSLISTPNSKELKEGVCRFLKDIEYNFQHINLFNHNIQQSIVLNKQYIPIQVTLERRYHHEIETSWSYGQSEAELKRIYALKGFDEEKQKEAIKDTQANWLQTKDKHQKIIILADPGMGKSTLLKMESITIAKTEINRLTQDEITVEDVIFPLFIRLSDIARYLAISDMGIIEIIPICIRCYYPKTSAAIEHLLVEKLNKGKCLLLFDAWDEVPIIQRHSLLQKLDQFVNQFVNNSSNQIILTSRIVGYRGSVIDGAKEIEIIPFTQWQKEKYIENWFINAKDYIGESSVSSQGLINELRQKPQIAGLVQNPLLLSLVCSLYQNKDSILPTRRCQLYKIAVNYILDKWRLDNRRLEKKEGWIFAKIELLEVRIQV